MEGSRPILAEIQALVTKTAYGTPRRMSAGVDYNRMVLLLAILEKRVGLYLSSSDAYINVIGGMRLDEPAIDLPIALAVASSYRDQPLPEGVMSFGEVGLTGELRAVTAVSQRIHEAIRLGFTTCIMPKQDIGRMEIPKTFRIVQTENIAQAIGAAFGRK